MPEGKERGKECSNLIILISELYNFQVISCVLLFDVVRSLLEGRLTEMDVELLLKILRSKFSFSKTTKVVLVLMKAG